MAIIRSFGAVPGLAIAREVTLSFLRVIAVVAAPKAGAAVTTAELS